MTDIRKQTFGIEIETVGRDREETAKLVANYFGTSYDYEGGYYNKYVVRDNKNRKWTFMTDGSLSRTRSCEVVSPVLAYDDIEMLQEVVRALRKGGCEADSSCGIHVHVGTDEVEDFARYAKNLSNLVETHYELLLRALNVLPQREHWCASNERFQNALNKKSPKTEVDVLKAWYNEESEAECEYRKSEHYDHSRYHLLNMHSYFQGKGVEFRAFNGTMHAGEIRAYICLCLALNSYAINAKFAGKKNIETSNKAYTFMHWIVKLGLVGDEFKNVRLHLIKNLNGNVAHKNILEASRRAV